MITLTLHFAVYNGLYMHLLNMMSVAHSVGQNKTKTD